MIGTGPEEEDLSQAKKGQVLRDVRKRQWGRGRWFFRHTDGAEITAVCLCCGDTSQ